MKNPAKTYMRHDDHAVLGEMHVRLHALRPSLYGSAHRQQRVLGPLRLVPAVRDRLRHEPVGVPFRAPRRRERSYRDRNMLATRVLARFAPCVWLGLGATAEVTRTYLLGRPPAAMPCPPLPPFICFERGIGPACPVWCVAGPYIDSRVGEWSPGDDDGQAPDLR